MENMQEIEETAVVSTDADWDGDGYVDCSEVVTTELTLSLEDLVLRISKLLGPGSNLYIHSYDRNTLVLTKPNDGNEYYRWWGVRESHKVFESLGLKAKYSY